MGAIADLWKSERGLVAITLIVATTVLCAISVITAAQWLDYTKWIFVTYAAAKTVTGVSLAIKSSNIESAKAAAAGPASLGTTGNSVTVVTPPAA